MTNPITGGCRCGAVRYECSARPVTAVTCSCSDCLVFYGGVMSAALVVPRDAVSITGQVTYFDVQGVSGKPVSRGFCPTCGTQLFGKPGIAPQLMAVTAGSLDASIAFRPRMNVFAANAHPWVHLDDDIVSFPAMPDEVPEV